MCPAGKVLDEVGGEQDISHLHEGVGDSGEESSCSCGRPEIVEAGVVLKV